MPFSALGFNGWENTVLAGFLRWFGAWLIERGKNKPIQKTIDTSSANTNPASLPEVRTADRSGIDAQIANVLRELRTLKHHIGRKDYAEASKQIAQMALKRSTKEIHLDGLRDCEKHGIAATILRYEWLDVTLCCDFVEDRFSQSECSESARFR